MPTSQIIPRETDHARVLAIPARGVTAKRRAGVANVFLLAAVGAALAAGLWGLSSSLATLSLSAAFSARSAAATARLR